LPNLDENDSATAAALRLSTGQSTPTAEHARRGQDWATESARAAADFGVDEATYKAAVFAKTFGLQPGASMPGVAGQQAQAALPQGEYTAIGQRAFSNNQKRIMQTLQKLVDGDITQVMAEQALASIGLTPDRIAAYITDALDGGIEPSVVQQIQAGGPGSGPQGGRSIDERSSSPLPPKGKVLKSAETPVGKIEIKVDSAEHRTTEFKGDKIEHDHFEVGVYRDGEKIASGKAVELKDAQAAVSRDYEKAVANGNRKGEVVDSGDAGSREIFDDVSGEMAVESIAYEVTFDGKDGYDGKLTHTSASGKQTTYNEGKFAYKKEAASYLKKEAERTLNRWEREGNRAAEKAGAAK
jgi:hypothetical protein